MPLLILSSPPILRGPTHAQKLWALDRDTFADVVNQSGSELKRIFEKFSVVPETGEHVPQRYMTLDGFIAAFTQHRDNNTSVPNADQEAENARLRVLVCQCVDTIRSLPLCR